MAPGRVRVAGRRRDDAGARTARALGGHAADAALDGPQPVVVAGDPADGLAPSDHLAVVRDLSWPGGG
ncbi:hypothetical protein [Geodermatophilus sp. CPCC 206100]|uniref:hypothetical protein n=1 Tax=Geodermatophilus sp. CPCC 206100 TaxID=3020054 RepID=UPI003B00BF3C